jgi:hypothetical protein
LIVPLEVNPLLEDFLCCTIVKFKIQIFDIKSLYK